MSKTKEFMIAENYSILMVIINNFCLNSAITIAYLTSSYLMYIDWNITCYYYSLKLVRFRLLLFLFIIFLLYTKIIGKLAFI